MRPRTRLWCRSVLTPGHGVVVDGAAAVQRAMTVVTAGDVGGLLMPAPPECLSKPTLAESDAEPMAQQSSGFRGRDTTWVIPATSTRRLPGLLCGHRRVRPVNCWGWRGGPSGRSSPGSTMMLKRLSTVLGVCVGSGSTRSPTNGDTVTRSWLLTTHRPSCLGRTRPVRDRSRRVLRRARSREQPRSPMFLLIWPTGSPKLLQLAHRMRSAVPTRSMLSPGRSKP